ncbi:nitroreductase family protein [Ideonella alba]|uniref:Nitroreductase family protein n=1 Tax=Ideonella alba TaxID=2824118 RepID=A0A940Y7H8_9BURK|nr:nitroreductase family protein [Ideonella alba]MBQ0931312.1 nitroreductase family protein [Ideonella alba]
MTEADAFHRLLQAHRSIRCFRSDPVDDALVDACLVDALQGSSSSGNLNMVSVVKTRDQASRRQLHALHGEQDMILQAPLLLTFCADTHRTRAWLAERGARLGFSDLVSWHVASFDAMIIAQTAALALESHGLGICYMGTTLFSMAAIAELLGCPDHVLPVTTLVVGWPDEAPAQRDRLPASAWIHDERYQRLDAASIERDFREREERGKARYLAVPHMAERWRELGIESLAHYYTSPIKYDPDVFAEFSAEMEQALRRNGFLA